MTTQTAAPLAIPGYEAATWVIDPSHSEVSFTIRHLMLAKVRGRFTSFEGQIVTAADPLDSEVSASIDLASIDTADPDRDAHVRSADFFEVQRHPTMTFRSTGVRAAEEGFVVDGELTLHGVTRPVALELELNGFQPVTPFGDSRVGFSARTRIDRREFGITYNAALELGGVALGDKVDVTLEVEAVRADA